MGQRRKHMLQAAVNEEVQPPADGQHIVRALGSRGGNIVEVQYPDGATTLCMMPARFNRKLWVRRGGYLVIEACPEAAQDAGSRVTGTICAVLYDDAIKALKRRHPGVWPAEFADASQRGSAAAGGQQEGGDDVDMPEACSSSGSSSGDDDADDDTAGGAAEDEGAEAGSAAASRGAARPQQQQEAATAARGSGQQQQQQQQQQGDEQEEEEDSDDGLPPLQQIHNRRVIHHYVSDSDEGEDSD